MCEGAVPWTCPCWSCTQSISLHVGRALHPLVWSLGVSDLPFSGNCLWHWMELRLKIELRLLNRVLMRGIWVDHKDRRGGEDIDDVDPEGKGLRCWSRWDPEL